VRRPSSLVILVLLGAVAAPGRAAAAPPEASEPPPRAEPNVALALVAGAATALIPMALGVSHLAAQSPATDGPRNVGFAVSGVGPALAPIVAHAVLGEYGRAALFGALPVAAEISLCAYVAAMPDSVFHGTMGSSLGFGLLYTADLLGAAVGMVDVMMARERARLERRRGPDLLGGVTVAPRVGRDQAGIVLGGVW
jgi:hypothetical protein